MEVKDCGRAQYSRDRLGPCVGRITARDDATDGDGDGDNGRGRRQGLR